MASNCQIRFPLDNNLFMLRILNSFPPSLEVSLETHTFHLLSGGFRFCEDEDEDDDVDVETIFRSAFGGNRFYYWSFINEENNQWSSSSRYSRNSWNWRQRIEEEYQYEYEYDCENSESDLASHRLALGLSASGPLKLEDVKNA